MGINSYSFLSELLIFLPLLLFLLFFAWYFLNAEFRKGSLTKTKAHYQESFITENPSTETFKAILQFAIQNGYRIDDINEQQKSVVLNERMTLTSYGSLYPIYVRENAGKTSVEVGVTSKLGKVFLISPINKKLVTLRLERMVNGVKSSIVAFDTRN